MVKRAIGKRRSATEEEAVQGGLALWEERGAQAAGILAVTRRKPKASLARRRGPTDHGRIDEGRSLRMSSSTGGRDWLRNECVTLMDFRVAPQAESTGRDLVLPRNPKQQHRRPADRVIDSITARFGLFPRRQPYIGRRRDEDLRLGVRSFVVGDYVIAYRR